MDEQNEAYIDYDSKPKFILRTWLGDNRYAPAAEMKVTDEEWERFKALNQPIDDRVVECYKDASNCWRFMRFRDDKENGNHETTFHKVLQSISDGVSKKELLDACASIKNNWKLRQQQQQHHQHQHQHQQQQQQQRKKEHALNESQGERDPKRLKGHAH